ncbi:neuronal acetylcholine receptor subunit beta-3-like isoform X2 [Dreissena polymorpha]|nr:neuronal acetylcholine receptor subunit beta-3-like isoform X2 [Dreissena polymorpha]
MDSEDASGSKIEKKCLSIGYNSNSLPDIYNKIMERYRKNLHPNFGSQETFNVTINSRLETLIQLDQVEERLSSVMSFTINWRDTRLDWMNDILCLVNQNVSAKLPRQAFFMELDKELIWRPSITIANPHSPRYMLSDNIGSQVVDVMFLGEVTWEYSQIVETRCSVDSTHFPFDKQFCEIQISVPSYSGSEISLTHCINPDTLSTGEWQILTFKQFQTKKKIGFRQVFIIEYELERKPLNTFVIIVIPVFILVSMVPLVFLIPKESGERLSLAVTGLLAVSVYMSLVAGSLPSSSDPMPLINVCIFVWFLSNAAIVIIVILDSALNVKKETKHVPSVCDPIVTFARRLRCEVKKVSEHDSSEEDIEMVSHNDGTHNRNDRGKSNFQDRKITWQHVSRALDTYMIVIIYAIKIVFAVCVFIVLYYGDVDKSSPRVQAARLQSIISQVIVCEDNGI